jgi:hypothetical protein
VQNSIVEHDSATPARLSDPEDTSTPAESSQAVQLVSFTQRETEFDAIDAIDSELRESSNKQGGSTFSLDLRGLDLALTDQWLEQRDQVEEELARLDQLLDAIVTERAEASLTRRPSIGWENLESAAVGSPVASPSAWGGGMILLLPESTLSTGSAEFALQDFGEIDDAAIGHWSVGIGVHRALQLTGGELVDALVFGAVSEATVGEGLSLTRFDSHLPIAPTARESSSSSALGVVVGCLGIQYLRKRRKLPRASSLMA